MLYLNQNEYGHIPYMHGTDQGGAPVERRNVGTSGCGLCSLCMVVDHLTMKQLDLTECVRLSEKYGANHVLGTDMSILGPIVANMFDLDFKETRDRDEMLEHLRKGGEVIAKVANEKKDGTVGLFTYRRHYIVLLSVEDQEICILDPSLEEGKFEKDGREGKVRLKEFFVYCPVDTLMEEVVQDGFCFYLFKRKL